MSVDVKEIAGRLTKAQREAVTGRIVHISSRMRDPLVELGLLIPGIPNWSPLGLAVRNHLLATEPTA